MKNKSGENIIKQTELAQRIIVALDVDSMEKALDLVAQLKEALIFKVGLKLFTAEGPSLIEKISKMKKKIFLDLKMHDIPYTVAESVRIGVKHGVHMLTLHASGGKEMMARASSIAKEEATRKNLTKPLLLAVTILTSLKQEQLQEIGMNTNLRQQVLKLARLAQSAGMDGVVSSPQEIDLLKQKLGKKLLIVAPGIRPSWATAHDQKRIMTPSVALHKGADYLVIGRPIIQAESPRQAFLKVLEELHNSHYSPHCKNST